jgi:hypothetical protein
MRRNQSEGPCTTNSESEGSVLSCIAASDRDFLLMDYAPQDYDCPVPGCRKRFRRRMDQQRHLQMTGKEDHITYREEELARRTSASQYFQSSVSDVLDDDWQYQDLGTGFGDGDQLGALPQRIRQAGGQTVVQCIKDEQQRSTFFAVHSLF